MHAESKQIHDAYSKEADVSMIGATRRMNDEIFRKGTVVNLSNWLEVRDNMTHKTHASIRTEEEGEEI